MKVKFVVMEMSHREEREVKRFDSYEQAEGYIMEVPADELLGTVEMCIKKIYTNAQD